MLAVRVLCFLIATRPREIPYIVGRPKNKPKAEPSPLAPLNASAPLLRTGLSQVSEMSRTASNPVEQERHVRMRS